jgi:hypothetical protein
MYPILIILHTISLFVLGWVIVRKWFPGFPALLSLATAFLLGVGAGTPLTYVLSVLFVRTVDPLLWGTIAATIIAGVMYHVSGVRGNVNRSSFIVNRLSIVFVFICFIFSAWMMTKTFHGGPAGELFVGSNNVFDFGLSVGLMRSMSWGENIPFASPFFAGLPMLYHFYFNFWTALWEHLGIPTVWAINGPSILSFAALLIAIFHLPQVLFRQKPLAGWIAVLLTITNSSLTFWRLPLKSLWTLPTYPFAGPFDGSVISIFVTLNNYVNQRHLAFAMGAAMVLYMAASQKKSRALFVGVATGVLMGWNMPIYALTVVAIGLLYVVQSEWKKLLHYLIASALVGSLFVLPIAGFFLKAITFINVLVSDPVSAIAPMWSVGEYLWNNLGVLPIVFLLGIWVLPAKVRRLAIPFVILFIGEILLAAWGKRGFEQKSYSFMIIGVNTVAAVGIVWLWAKRQKVAKLSAIIFLFLLTVSGFVDLIPIKNEFAFPLVGGDTVSVISWIRDNTPKDAVFVSYEDMIDPVALAGRKNYYGFFKNIGQYDRSSEVKSIYAGNAELAHARGVSYILVPKFAKSDFPYVVNISSLDLSSARVYEDARYIVFSLIQ